MEYNKCKRCNGLMVEARYMDAASGMIYFDGVKCINCGFVLFETPGDAIPSRVGKGRFVTHKAFRHVKTLVGG